MSNIGKIVNRILCITLQLEVNFELLVKNKLFW